MSSVVIYGNTSGAITVSAPAISGTNTLTLPATTDTLVGKNTTDILTNKTLTNPTLNGFTGDTSAINIGPNQILKTISGNVVIGATTASISTTTGALVVKGGVGVAGNLFALTANVNSATVNNNLTVTGALSFGSLSGTVTVANGGTGATTLTANNVILGNGTGAVQFVAPGTSGNLLTSDGSSWVSKSTSSLNTGMKNKIINGDMNISQRGTSFAAIANGAYSLDRWAIFYVTTAVMTITQNSDVPSDNEFQNSLRANVTTADTSIAAGDYAIISQRIEGYNVRDLIGKDFTLSFWVRSSKTGTHCVSFRNSGSDRSYVSTYTINAANTWEEKSVTVTGGLITAGTWNWTTGIGLSVSWALAAGSTYQTTADAWQTGNFFATSAQVNCLDTISNIFAVTGIQLEVGSTATDFEHRPYGQELSLCDRYYYKLDANAVGDIFGAGYNYSTTIAMMFLQFPVSMRIAPTAIEQSGTAAHYAVDHKNTSTVCSAAPVFSSAHKLGSMYYFTVASGLTAGQRCMANAASTSAYLAWSAEL